MSAQDPFYLVKEEIQDSVDRVQKGHFEYEQGTGVDKHGQLKDLLSSCDSIEWQLEELDKAVAVAQRDPARFNVDSLEIERRRRWTSSTHNQISLLKRSLQSSPLPSLSKERDRRELLRIPDSSPSSLSLGGGGGRGVPRPDKGIAEENESFIGEEGDTQALLVRQQDEQLEAMSASLGIIGGLGIAIHDELGSQDKLISEINDDVANTTNRMELVQKRMQSVLKKAGFKGQLCLIVALIVLLLILIVLVFYT